MQRHRLIGAPPVALAAAAVRDEQVVDGLGGHGSGGQPAAHAQRLEHLVAAAACRLVLSTPPRGPPLARAGQLGLDQVGHRLGGGRVELLRSGGGATSDGSTAATTAAPSGRVTSSPRSRRLAASTAPSWMKQCASCTSTSRPEWSQAVGYRSTTHADGAATGRPQREPGLLGAAQLHDNETPVSRGEGGGTAARLPLSLSLSAFEPESDSVAGAAARGNAFRRRSFPALWISAVGPSPSRLDQEGQAAWGLSLGMAAQAETTARAAGITPHVRVGRSPHAGVVSHDGRRRPGMRHASIREEAEARVGGAVWRCGLI